MTARPMTRSEFDAAQVTREALVDENDRLRMQAKQDQAEITILRARVQVLERTLTFPRRST